MVDAEDARGSRIEVERHQRARESGAEPFNFLIPWTEVLAVVTAKEFSSAVHQEARRDRLHRLDGIGVTGLDLSEHHPLLIGWSLVSSQVRAISSVSNH